MNNKVELKYGVEELQLKVNKLLNKIAKVKCGVSEQEIRDLDYYAVAISKLAYGNNMPELIGSEAYNLIAWCDHIDEPDVLKSFELALRNRPLIQSVWSGGN
jgi:hypothetical protein